MRKAILIALALALSPMTVATAAQPGEDPVRAPGLRCTERVAMPPLENVIDAKWSPDGRSLALVRFARIPSPTNPSGYVEDEVLELVDMITMRVRSYGSIEYGRPAWSASGRYLAYWGPKADFLQVMEDGEVIARLTPTVPEFRWAGDALLYMERSTTRVWMGGRTPSTIAKLADPYVTRYPRDHIHWSGDGSRFTLTRYEPDEPEPERFLGWTETSDVVPLDVPGAAFTEWAPSGAILLVRYPTRLEVRDEIRLTRASIPIARGALHSWGPDGRTLLVRAPRASVAAGGAFEEMRVAWPPSQTRAALLPDLFGQRTFSPDGRYFGGTVRTGRHDSRFEVFGCYEITRGDATAPLLGAPDRQAAIERETGRFVRPASAPISQFLHVAHSGVDLAAPLGMPVVAADDGVVTKTAWKEEAGLHACVQHAGELETCYYHASALLVGAGERVARGQPIALSGMSGRATGPHVHWEAKLNGKVIDPLLR